MKESNLGEILSHSPLTREDKAGTPGRKWSRCHKKACWIAGPAFSYTHRCRSWAVPRQLLLKKMYCRLANRQILPDDFSVQAPFSQMILACVNWHKAKQPHVFYLYYVQNTLGRAWWINNFFTRTSNWRSGPWHSPFISPRSLLQSQVSSNEKLWRTSLKMLLLIVFK